MSRNAIVAWARRNAIALVALFVALGGTGYAATAIDGELIENGTITGKKLRKDTLGGRQVKESRLGKVRSATRADSAAVADSAKSADMATNATNAGKALTAQTAETLGPFGPDVFVRTSQIEVRGPFETDPATGTDQDFFSFPEIDLAIKTPRAPNVPGSPGLVEIQQSDPTPRVIVHVRNASFESVAKFLGGESGVNYRVDQIDGDEDEDFLQLTVFSLVSDLVVWIECVADDSIADIPVTCVAVKSRH